MRPCWWCAIYVPGTALAQARKWYPRADSLVHRIPAERYYAYEALVLVPVTFGEAIVTAGVMRLLARLWHGQGRFDDLFALIGFSHLAVTLAIGIPDLVIGLRAKEQPPRPRWPAWPPHVWLGTLRPLLLTLLTVKETERLPWGQSTMITLVAAGANASIEFVFIR